MIDLKLTEIISKDFIIFKYYIKFKTMSDKKIAMLHVKKQFECIQLQLL